MERVKKGVDTNPFPLRNYGSDERSTLSRIPTVLKFSARETMIIALTILLTLFISQIVWKEIFPAPTVTIAGKSLSEVTSGTVALTEEELKQAVLLLGSTVYWAGPVANYKYTIEDSINGQIFIKYLPNGQGAIDPNPVYRVIATYQLENAYNSTKVAGAIEGDVGLTSPDGAAVYFDKNQDKNVYLAFEDQDFQIEIYDPGEGVSLAMAIEPGRIRKI